MLPVDPLSLEAEAKALVDQAQAIYNEPQRDRRKQLPLNPAPMSASTKHGLPPHYEKLWGQVIGLHAVAEHVRDGGPPGVHSDADLLAQIRKVEKLLP